MNHEYRTHLIWDGNRGDGTATYAGYGREHRILIDGKPELLATADAAFFVVTRDQLNADLDRMKAQAAQAVAVGANVHDRSGVVVGPITVVDAESVTVRVIRYQTIPGSCPCLETRNEPSLDPVVGARKGWLCSSCWTSTRQVTVWSSISVGRARPTSGSRRIWRTSRAASRSGRSRSARGRPHRFAIR